MLKKYLMIFLVSMVPLIELRGAVPIAVGMNLPLLPSYIICILGNMLPVPIIFFFARKVLEWGADKPVIGKFFTFCLEKGHKGGQKPVSYTHLVPKPFIPYIVVTFWVQIPVMLYLQSKAAYIYA